MHDEAIVFSIKYDGDALKGWSMDVKNLAPSLLALWELIEHVDIINNWYTSNLKTHIKWDFKTWSFQTFLEVIYSNRDRLSALLNSDNISAITNAKDVLEVIFWIWWWLIYLIKKIWSNKIVSYDETEEDIVVINLSNGTSITQTKKVRRTYKSHKARKAVEKMIYFPLKSEGINSFHYSMWNATLDIDKEESKHFECPAPQDELIGEFMVEKVVQLVSISFKEDNKRRLTDWSSIFYATVNDANYIDKIRQNAVRFAKDDTLKVKMLQRQLMTLEGLKSEYELIEVIDHKPAITSVSLFD
jgi:hypothetical protein